MLPKFLQSSFKTYKEDTNTIAQWLASKAQQCGYPSDLLEIVDKSSEPPSKPPAKSQRLKGSARKKAQNAAKSQQVNAPSTSETVATKPHIIKVKQFTTLAEYIVGFKKPSVKVPQFVASALDRAIDLRKKQSSWYRDQNGTKDTIDAASDADESHSFFLNILEKTREILKPCLPAHVPSDFLSKPKGDTEPQTDSEIRNKFAELDVHEPSEAFNAAPNVIVPDPKSSNEPRYEAETVRSLKEKYLAAHCLLQDVRKIRTLLCQLWKSYLRGMDVAAISVTVNTAISFVRDLESDFIHQFPQTSDYQDIVEIFFQAQCLSSGNDPSHRQQPDDPINFDVYNLAEDCLLTTFIIVSSVQDVISPGSLPVYKPGHFGHRDLRSDWSTKSPKEKFRDDKLVLLEAFPDIMLMTTITSKQPLVEDELLRGFREMAPGKSIPLWLVFAAQCFLDAQHELKQTMSRPHEELKATANAIRGSVSLNLKFHEKLRVDTWPKENDLHFSEMLRVIKQWVEQDMIAEKLRSVSYHLFWSAKIIA